MLDYSKGFGNTDASRSAKLPSDIMLERVIERRRLTPQDGQLMKRGTRCPLWVKSRHVQCTRQCPLSARSGPQMSEEAVSTWLNSKQKAASIGGLNQRAKIKIRYYM